MSLFRTPSSHTNNPMPLPTAPISFGCHQLDTTSAPPLRRRRNSISVAPSPAPHLLCRRSRRKSGYAAWSSSQVSPTDKPNQRRVRRNAICEPLFRGLSQLKGTASAPAATPTAAGGSNDAADEPGLPARWSLFPQKRRKGVHEVQAREILSRLPSISPQPSFSSVESTGSFSTCPADHPSTNLAAAPPTPQLTLDETLLSFDFPTFSLNTDELKTMVVTMITDVAPSLQTEKHASHCISQFVDAVELRYRNVPYHGFRHAFDVTQMMYLLLNRYLIPSGVIHKPIASLTLILASLCHDLGHTGQTNAFLREHNDNLCAVFGTNSTLERLHCSIAEEILRDHPMMLYLATEDREQLLANLQGLILATDMDKHAELVAEFQGTVLAGPSATVARDAKREHFLMLAMCIKVADLSNVSRPNPLANCWNWCLDQELSNLNCSSNAPPSDLTQAKPSGPTPEMRASKFAEFLVLPLVRLFETHCPALVNVLTANIEANIQAWTRMESITSAPATPPKRPFTRSVSVASSTTNHTVMTKTTEDSLDLEFFETEDYDDHESDYEEYLVPDDVFSDDHCGEQ